jgi:hypothetical protein
MDIKNRRSQLIRTLILARKKTAATNYALRLPCARRTNISRGIGMATGSNYRLGSI